MIWGLENIITATYALHFANEDIQTLLQVGASTKGLKSGFSDPQYVTPSYYTMQLSYSFKVFKNIFFLIKKAL